MLISFGNKNTQKIWVGERVKGFTMKFKKLLEEY